MSRRFRLKDVLENEELVRRIAAWLNTEEGKIVRDIVEPLCRPPPLTGNSTEFEAAYKLGLSSGSFSILDFIWRIPEMSQVIRSGTIPNEPDYGAMEILKKEYGYDGKPGKRSK